MTTDRTITTKLLECAWCGGECAPREYWNRAHTEVFCSKSHRDSAVRALRRFRLRTDPAVDLVDPKIWDELVVLLPKPDRGACADEPEEPEPFV